MPDASQNQAHNLATLRSRIDGIDAEMHRLLIERGTVIGALNKAKGAQRPGAAFRPAREAAMMRRIAARHQGELPLATVEHIWREIIATFTLMQAPYEVAIDVSNEPERMRDLARFIFGFSVAVRPMAGPAAVVERVAAGRDLGIVARQAEGAWWAALKGEQRPRITAILPFIRARGRPAELPAFVVSPQLADPTPAEIAVFAVSSPGPLADLADLADMVVLAQADDGGGRQWLLADAAGRDSGSLAAALPAEGGAAVDVVRIGGFARPIDEAGEPFALAALA